MTAIRKSIAEYRHLPTLIDSSPEECRLSVGEVATHVATHNKLVMHVLGRTYAAVRDLQVIEGAG